MISFELVTGKSMSEALNLASTNPQLSIELPIQCMKIPSLEQGEENMR